MDWNEAKTSTLKTWDRIREAIDREDELELLTEINAICDLCVQAKHESAGSLDHCPRCPAYQQFGGCREVNTEMNVLVVDRDWAGLRRAVDDFLANLHAMEAEPVVRSPSPGREQ